MTPTIAATAGNAKGPRLANIFAAPAATLTAVLASCTRANAFSAAAMIAAQQWVERRALRSSRESSLDHAARLLVATRGRTRIDAIADRSGLSLRQFQRRFAAEVGVSPKFYARTLRLEAALAARNRYPERSWTTIVHEAGYADQAHFIRDCQLLAGATPTAFVTQASGVAEIFNSETA